MIEFQQVLQKLLGKENLQEDEIAVALYEMIQGRINTAQIAAFLTALKVKGETTTEIASIVKIMKKNAVTINPKVKHLIDVAGTGGDCSNTFNISTCSAFVAAGAKANVAKHGNRAISSSSGSADVLEELGIDIGIDAKTAEKQLEQLGITFLFAPLFHPAMKNIATVRKELGFKTVFNVIGPLTNPANAKRQVIGIYGKEVLRKMAEVLKLLKMERVLLASSNLDEISLNSETSVCEISKGKMKQYVICPADFGFKPAGLDKIRAADKSESARVILDVLNGRQGPARDITLMNAGAAIYVSGLAKSMNQGIALAEKSIDSGKALEKLELMRNYDGYT